MTAHPLLIATRKGLFVATGDASGLRIGPEEPHFAGEPVTQVLVDPRDGTWYAALRMGHFGVKLRRSQDQGASWTECAAPAFPAKPKTGPMADDPTPWSVDLIWVLAAGGADQPGVLWAGCLPAGLFRSSDHGNSWTLVESLWNEPRRLAWFGGGYDHAGIHSIVVDPRDSNRLTVAISCGGIWQSADAGQSWTLIGHGQQADYMPPGAADELNTQDPHCLTVCAAAPEVVWVQHHCGQFRSIDGGREFTRLQPPIGQGFGFAVVADPRNPLRAWFVPAVADQKRYAIAGALCVLRTDDGGQTFSELRNGLPQQHAWQLVYRHALVVDDSGRRLAFGSTTGAVWLSNDAGDRWQSLEAGLPPIAALAWDQVHHG